MRKKLFKGFFYSLTAATTYYYTNKIYSEYHEIKKMKRKLIKQYPNQTFIISFD